MPKEKYHPIFDLAIAKTNNLRRFISCYRILHIPKIFIQIGVHFPHDTDEIAAGKELFITLSVKKGNLLRGNRFEETFYLYPQSERCQIFVSGQVRSITNKAIHSFHEWHPDDEDHSKYYTSKEIADRSSWIRRQLNVLAKWLKSPDLVRVDPYHPENILTEEETEADKVIERNLGLVRGFELALKDCEIKPGIISPEQEYKRRN